MAPSLPAAAAAAAPALQPRLSFPHELRDPARGLKGTYHDHQRLKAQFGERLRRCPRHRRPRGPQLPNRDCWDHRHDSGWSQDLEADIAAICCEAGLAGGTADTVLAAARRGLVSANPGVLLAQLLALSTSLDPHLGQGAAAHALCACPSLLNHDAATLLFNYQAAAPLFSPSRVAAMYRAQPGLLVCSPFRVWSVLQQLAQQLECTTDEAAAVAAQQPSLLLSSPTTLQQRQQQLAAAAGLSQATVCKLLRGCPLLLTLSAVTLRFKYEEMMRQLAPYVVLYEKRGRGRHKRPSRQQQPQEQEQQEQQEAAGQESGPPPPHVAVQVAQQGVQQQQGLGGRHSAADVGGVGGMRPLHAATYSSSSSSSSSTQAPEWHMYHRTQQPRPTQQAGQAQLQDCQLSPLDYAAAAAAAGADLEPRMAMAGQPAPAAAAAGQQGGLMTRPGAAHLQPAGALKLRAVLQQGRTRAAGVLAAVRRAAARARAAEQRQVRQQQQDEQTQAQAEPAATAGSQLKARILRLRQQQQQPKASRGRVALSGAPATAGLSSEHQAASAPRHHSLSAARAPAAEEASGVRAAAAATAAAAGGTARAAHASLTDPLPRLTPQQRQVLQRVVCKAPTLLTLDPTGLPSRLEQLRSALRLPPAQLAQLLVRQPRLLTTLPATVAGKVALLQQLTGRSQEQVCDMVYSAPALLTLSCDNLAAKWRLLWELTAPCITWRQQLVGAPPSTLAALLCCSEVRLRRLQELSGISSSSSSRSVHSSDSDGTKPAAKGVEGAGAASCACRCSSSSSMSGVSDDPHTATTTSSSSSRCCPLGSLPWRTLVRLSDAAYRDRMTQPGAVRGRAVQSCSRSGCLCHKQTVATTQSLS